MASTILFIVMAILAALLLLAASIAATIGAADAFGSNYYNGNEKLQSAHQYLTISAALGWSALVTLVVIFIIAAIAGGFSVTEVKEAVLTKTTPTKADLINAYKGEQKLSSGHTTQIIVIIILIVIALITFVVGILSILAAIQLGGLSNKDPKASNAYTASIIAAVAGVGGIAMMIVAVVTYIGIRSARQKELKETEAYIKLGEAKLGIKPEELKAAATAIDS